MEDLPLFSLWKGRSYGSRIVIRAIFTAFSTPDHLALPPTVGWQGAPFCVESAYLSRRSPSSVGSRLRSHKTETCPEIVGPKIRSPQCPDCGQWNQTWRASIRRHRRAQGGSQTLRSIRPKRAAIRRTWPHSQHIIAIAMKDQTMVMNHLEQKVGSKSADSAFLGRTD